MTGFTCGEHIATTLERTPVLCRRWVPSFARACGDCGADADRLGVLAAKVIVGVAFQGACGGDVAKTVRRMKEASAGFRAHKRRERAGA